MGLTCDPRRNSCTANVSSMDSKSLRSEFDAFDTDGNGVISKGEFMAMMGKLRSKGSATGVKALSDIIEVVIARHETKDKPSNTD